MRQLLAFVLLFSVPAIAWADCTDFDEVQFRALVQRAQDALFDDDVIGHGEAYREIQRSLPCMTGQVPKDAWAEFLVGLSVVEYAMGQEWQQPLSTALTIHPTVDRGYGPPDVRGFAPLADHDEHPPLPDNGTFFLDGVLINSEQPMTNLHILQRLQRGVWQTRLVRGEGFPDDWKVQFEDEVPDHLVDGGTTTTPAPKSPGTGLPVWGVAAATGGFGTASQQLDDPGAYIDNVDDAGFVAGIGSFGMYEPTDLLGLWWDVEIPFNTASSAAFDIYLGPSVALGPVRLWPGLGATTLTVTEGGSKRLVLIPQPRLGVQTTLPIADAFDFEGGLAAGWTVPATHLQGRAGLIGKLDAPVGWYAGAEFSFVRAAFQQDGVRDVGVSRWHGGLRAGISFGG